MWMVRLPFRRRLRRLPGRLLIVYVLALAATVSALYGLAPSAAPSAAAPDAAAGAPPDGPTEPAVPALAEGDAGGDTGGPRAGTGGGAADGAGSGWVAGILRLGLPLLDVYDGVPLFNWRGLSPLSLLQAEMPVLALAGPEAGEDGGAGAGPGDGSPLPLPYVAPDAEAGALASRPLPPPDRPLVIVYQTHAHEAFQPSLKAAGLPSDSPYTDAADLSIIRVGEEVARTLQEDFGIPTLHLRTPFDAGGLTGAYMESLKGLEAAMARYPTARVLLDIHRDSSGREATVTVVGGKPVARVMFVVGRGNDHLPNPHWEKNQAFGREIARALDTAVRPDPLPAAYAGTPGQRFPPMVRQLADDDGEPWTFGRNGRFNQHLSERAILIEIGGPENTVAEELRAARLVARAVAEVLKR